MGILIAISFAEENRNIKDSQKHSEELGADVGGNGADNAPYHADHHQADNVYTAIVCLS